MTPIKSLRIDFLFILKTILICLTSAGFETATSVVGKQFIIFGLQTEMKIPRCLFAE